MRACIRQPINLLIRSFILVYEMMTVLHHLRNSDKKLVISCGIFPIDISIQQNISEVYFRFIKRK